MAEDFQTGWLKQKSEIDDATRVFKTARPLIILMAVAVWGYVFLGIYWGNASRSWTGYVGTVVSSQIVSQNSSDSRGTSYQANITYQFDVDGHSTVGNSISAPYNLSGTFLNGHAQSQQLVDKYPVGTRVVVYAEGPNSPNSCLVPGINFLTLSFVSFFGILFTVMAMPPSWLRRQAKPLNQPPLKRADGGWIIESDSRTKM